MIKKVPFKKLTIASSAAITGELDIRDAYIGFVIVPSAWTAANIGFKIATESGGTFVTARDDSGSPIQISGIETSSSRAYKIPDDIFGVGYVKLWSKSATAATETDVNQGAARTLYVITKS